MDNEVSHCSCPSHLPCSTFFLSGHSRLMPSASALIITCMERVTLLDTTKLPLTPNLWGTRVLVCSVFVLHQSSCLARQVHTCTHTHTNKNSSSNLLPAHPDLTIFHQQSYRSAKFPERASDLGCCFSHSGALPCSTMLFHSMSANEEEEEE